MTSRLRTGLSPRPAASPRAAGRSPKALDFFLYIGITAIVRSVIIAHDTAFDILIWAISIFVLVCSLVLVKKYIGHDE